MRRHLLYAFVPAFLTVALITGCATVLPPEYGTGGRERVLSGPILALAGEGALVVAANPEGVYMKGPDGNWKRWDVPGISDYRKVSVLAVRDSEICVGTDGEGLHIYSNGTWEVRTARYGGLPDDNVMSLAYDGKSEGLSGENLWVGTAEGIALRRDGTWAVYTPGKSWLTDIVDEGSDQSAKIYIGPGYNLGGKGEDSRYFKPPVTAIGVGTDRVVLGNQDSRMAVIAPYGVATIYFTADAKITSLLVEKGVIWAGTNGGLVWGGLEGVAEGTPWPSHRMSVAFSGRLFETRDSRPFDYRWRFVGYNTATVPFLSKSGDSLWVVYSRPEGRNTPMLSGSGSENNMLTGAGDRGDIANPGLRRYVSIEDYIRRKERFVYETYARESGISGFPTVVLPLPDRGELWVGTTKGLYGLEK